MDATIKGPQLETIAIVELQPAWTDAIRLARYGWLNELPGLIFGIISVAYIVTSLMALK